MNEPIDWRKSSRSGTNGQSDCVEAAALSGGIGIRDSKGPRQGHLSLSHRQFRRLLTKVKAGDLDI